MPYDGKSNGNQGNEQSKNSRDAAKDEWDRRKFMKAGAAAGTGLLTASAGCTSESGGGGGDGSNGGDGSDGNGGDSDGSQSSREVAQIILAPTGFQGIIMDYLVNDTDILANQFDENNLDTEVARSWESAAIFTSGGADFGTFGSLEAAKLAGERDLPLAVNANLAPQFMCIIGAEGGPYDPDETGGSQASMDKLYEEQDRFALGGWGGGTGIMMPLIVSEAFGYTFTDDSSSDFENITTSEYAAVPQLVNDGNVVMGTSSPLHGAAPTMAPEEYDGDSNSITTIWQLGGAMADLENFSAPQLNSWACSQEYASENPGSPESMVQSFQTGVDWFYEDPIGRVEASEEHLRQLGLESMDAARYVMDWGINLELDNDLQVLYEDTGLTDEFIEGDKNFLASAQETGFLNEGWEENLEYRQIDASP